jgi:hypothetical protein
MSDLRTLRFIEHPDNPVISPPGREFIIADPTVVTPDLSPDGRFHLFAHSLRGIHHYASDDGIAFERIAGPLFLGLRPFVFVENGYHLFYERFVHPLKTVVAVRSSHDLLNWTEPRTVVAPQFRWEGTVLRNNGNPCVVKHEDTYRLYFAADWVWLKDCRFIEPKFIGVAESKLLLGPYEKRSEPIISPSPEISWRNLGAGSIKVFPPKGKVPWLALANGIYIDSQGASRSDIRVLKSTDGLDWEPVSEAPIIAPEPGWKQALVYAMHLSEYDGRFYLYFNARDGWFKGVERIGVAIATGT